MPLIHDPQTRASLEQRIRSLTPESRAAWGKMSVDQMLWHINQAMGLSLGTVTVGPHKPGIPAWLLRTFVLNMPWPKNGPTHPDFIPKERHDFAAERELALTNIARVTGKPMDDAWPVHPAFGRMSGRQVSALIHKHLNHHLTQFGA